MGARIMVPQRRFPRTRRAEIFTRQAKRIYRPVYAKGVVIRPTANGHGGDGDDADGWYCTRAFGWKAAAEEAQQSDDEEEEECVEDEEGEEEDDDDL